MAATPPPPVLTCKECGYQNEPERVYCHNCGSKLDRSILPKEEQLRREAPDKARKRIMRMTNPGASPVRVFISGSLKAIFLGAVAACVILMALEPEGVPKSNNELSLSSAQGRLMELVQAPAPRSAYFTETDINGFMGTGKSKGSPLVPGVEYKRSFVSLSPGVARITLERSFWGYSMYYGTLYRVQADAGVFTAVNIGGNVGRLAIHPAIMKRLEKVLLKDISETFKNELSQLQRMATIRIEDRRALLISAGPTAAR